MGKKVVDLTAAAIGCDPQSIKTHDEAMCTTKKQYRSQEHAQKVAWSSEQKRGVKLRVYQCPRCSWFHLTKQLK